MRAPITLTGLLVVSLVLGASMLEEAEVATLVTVDARRRATDTRLWIVDLDGHSWVRAPDPDSPWLARLRENPVVHLSRGGLLVSVNASPVGDGASLAAVNRVMAEKYGLLECAVGLFRDPHRAVAVRLDPVPVDAP